MQYAKRNWGLWGKYVFHSLNSIGSAATATPIFLKENEQNWLWKDWLMLEKKIKHATIEDHLQKKAMLAFEPGGVFKISFG